MPENQSQPDFLNIEPDALRAAEQERLRLEYEQLIFAVFVNNPAGVQLLSYWTEAEMWKNTPTNASLNDYVAAEAVRTFVRRIHGQIANAKTRGK